MRRCPSNLRTGLAGLWRAALLPAWLLACSVATRGQGISGLKATTYDWSGSPPIPNNSTPLSTLTVPNIDYSWGTGTVLNSGQSSTVQVKFEGYIKSTYAGTVSFRIYRNDGVRLTVGTATLIDNWTSVSSSTYSSTGSISFAANETKPILLWYYENTGSATCILQWSQGGGPWSVVPASALTLATVPSAPGTPTVSLGDGQASLSWAAPSSDGGDPIDDYAIEYSTNGSTWAVFADAVSTTRSATVTGLTNGTGYYFRLRATNAAGDGPYASVVGPFTPKGSQSITFNLIPTTYAYGDAVNLTATASSGLPVTYSVSPSTIAEIVNSQLVMRGVGTATVTATQAGNSTWSAAASVVRSVTVAARPLSVGAPGVTLSKVYDGLTAASVTMGAVSGVVAGDIVNVTASASYATAGVGTGKTVTVAYALSGAHAANYVVPSSQTYSTGSITSRALGVAGLAALSKEYDGTTLAALEGTPTLTGVLAGDSVALVGTASGAFSDPQLGVGKSVAVSGLGLGGAGAPNYTLAMPTLAADIFTTTPFVEVLAVGALSLSAGGGGSYGQTERLPANASAQRTVLTAEYSTFWTWDAYANNPVLLNGVDTSLGWSSGGTGNAWLRVVRDVMGLPMSYSSMTNTWRLSSDWNPSSIRNLSIKVYYKLGQLIGFGTLPDMQYGAGPIALSATSDSGLPVSYSVISGPATVSGTTLTITGVGTVVVRASQAGSSGYVAATPVDRAFTVLPRPLTVSGLAANPKDYDGSTSASISGTPVLTGAVEGDVVTLQGTAAAAFADPSVGFGKMVTVSGLSLVGASASNYTLVVPTLTADIRAVMPSVEVLAIGSVSLTSGGAMDYAQSVQLPADVLVRKTVLTAEYSTYWTSVAYANNQLLLNGVNSGLGWTSGGTGNAWRPVTKEVTGLPPSYSVGGNTWRFTSAWNPSSIRNLSVRVYYQVQQTIHFTALPNVTYGDGPLTLSASSSSGLPVSYSLVSGPATLSGNILALTGAGTVVVRATQGGDMTFADASAVERSFNVSPRQLTVAGLAAASRTYDGTTAAAVTGTPVLDGVILGDEVTVSGTATGTFADKNVGVGKTVTVSGLMLGGADAANYELGTVALTADISAKALRVIANSQQKAYDGLVFAGFTVRWEGFVSGETESLAMGSVGFAGDAVTAVAVGTYTIIPLTSAVTVPNYALEAEAGPLEISDPEPVILLSTRAGGVGLSRVVDVGGEFELTATMGEAAVGDVTVDVVWTLRTGFWNAVEEGFLEEAGPTSLDRPSHAVSAGVLKGGDVPVSTSLRRLSFGLDAGNRLALPSIGDAGVVVPMGVHGAHPQATLQVVGRMQDGWLRFEARAGASGRWLVQARTDWVAGEWRTVSWIDLDEAGLGWIDLEPAAIDATVLLRLAWTDP